MQNKKIVFLIPCKNEEEALPWVLKTLAKVHVKSKTELVIVDDGSTDRTVEIAKKFTNHVIQIPTDQSQGVGHATIVGMEFIRDVLDPQEPVDYIIKLDGDGQHDPTLVRAFIGHFKNGAHLVIGSRFTPASEQRGTPFSRHILNMWAAHLVCDYVRRPLHDVRSGYMGISMDIIRAITHRLITRGYGIPMDIIICAAEEDTPERRVRIHEINHPAIYGGKKFKKLREKLETQWGRQAEVERTDAIFKALLDILNAREPRAAINQMFNGFCRSIESFPPNP